MTDDDELIEHGTYRGYKAHLRHGIDPCEPCRIANNEKMREYRASNPAFRQQQSQRNGTRYRAMLRLANAHPDEFRRLLNEEIIAARQRRQSA